MATPAIDRYLAVTLRTIMEPLARLFSPGTACSGIHLSTLGGARG